MTTNKLFRFKLGKLQMVYTAYLTLGHSRLSVLDISLILTGGAHHDFKLAEHSGGYGYRDSGKINAVTRNRFIYWLVVLHSNPTIFHVFLM